MRYCCDSITLGLPAHTEKKPSTKRALCHTATCCQMPTLTGNPACSLLAMRRKVLLFHPPTLPLASQPVLRIISGLRNSTIPVHSELETTQSVRVSDRLSREEERDGGWEGGTGENGLKNPAVKTPRKPRSSSSARLTIMSTSTTQRHHR